MSSPELWRFGPFRLDPTSGSLWHGDELLTLRPKPLSVLAFLVAHTGEVVTKDALLDAVWPDTIVSDGVLKDCISQVRTVLGETARDPQYIATVHRRGYRFIASVSTIDDPETSATPSDAREVAARPLAQPLAGLTPSNPARVDYRVRRLAAILSTEVQGYSRLIGDDEAATVQTLMTYRALMSARIEQHQGRVVNAPGDNLLAEFASVVDAVQCAVAIQDELAEHNRALPGHRQMRFRIGINLGDVLVEGEQIYGDGVNIAARLEGLAEGGGICISGTAYDQIENKLNLTYTDLGEQRVKNIVRPVRVYRVESGTAPGTLAEPPAPLPAQVPAVSPIVRRPFPLVGREAELAHLHQWFAQALEGERQMVFIMGEVGIGKTTLVDTFVAQSEHEERLWVGHGQCVEQYGAGEPYLPLLEAFGRLGKSPEGSRLVELLWQYAPSWLMQLPSLSATADFEMLQRRGGDATRERMLRELAEVVEILTAERPLILVLEDLHWSDTSTLEWLAYVARRRETARLLVLGTYRPVEAIVQGHPLRRVAQELQGHGQGQELGLDYLSEPGVAAYLEQRFPGKPFPEALPQIIHQRTNGNPLFMVSLVDNVVRQGILQEEAERLVLPRGLEAVAAEVPESLRQLIEQQLDRLVPEDYRVLEAASDGGRVLGGSGGGWG